jgi:anti-sigma-K factor RskA
MATQESEDRETGLPALRSWRAVYAAVAAVVVVWLGLLAVLTRLYS